MSSIRLNSRQAEAVKEIASPTLVLAGAGSGKTSVITAKIVHLIEEAGYRASQITAVTFTNKAAKEMKERVSTHLDRTKGRGLTVSTFHNLGLNIIRREHKQLGFKSNFTIFDDQDTIALIRELQHKDAEVDKAEMMAIQSGISKLKNELTSPDQAIAQAKDQDALNLAKLYEKYDRSMRAYNAVDFDDLIRYPVMLFESNADVLERWQQKIRYLLVDEYQDTNQCQYQLVKLLCGKFGVFTVVGDDDQSIYSWRGAQPENLALLQQDYPNLKVIKLEQNYRSFGRILKVANEIIANNPHVFEKALWSDKDYGEPIRVISCDNDADEAERVAKEIMAKKIKSGCRYDEFAVLYRGNHQSRFIEKALIEKQIPYKVNGSTSFFSRIEIKDVMAYLRLLANPDDDNAFLRIVNTPRREIGPSTLEKLGLYAHQRNIGLFAACFELGLEQSLSGKGLTAIKRFAQFIASTADQLAHEPPIKVINNMMAEIGYHTYLFETASSTAAAEFRWGNVQELLSWIDAEIKNFSDDESPLARALNKLMLREMLDRNEDDDEGDEVQLMTLHASKGLEFPTVYLVGMEEELLPHRTSIDEDNIEEERRLAYVGVTRAKQRLILSYARQRKRYGDTMDTEPSRFLFEMPKDDLLWEEQIVKTSEAERKEKGKQNIAQLRAMLADQS